jgi:hypothetical protein
MDSTLSVSSGSLPAANAGILTLDFVGTATIRAGSQREIHGKSRRFLLRLPFKNLKKSKSGDS